MWWPRTSKSLSPYEYSFAASAAVLSEFRVQSAAQEGKLTILTTTVPDFVPSSSIITLTLSLRITYSRRKIQVGLGDAIVKARVEIVSV